MAVVSILNSMSTKSDRVLKVLRFIVYRSLIGNFHLKAKYINTAFNSIADTLSRAQFQKFKELAPHADSSPTMVPYEFLIFLNDNIKVLKNSISKNSWRVYDSAVASFENF